MEKVLLRFPAIFPAMPTETSPARKAHEMKPTLPRSQRCSEMGYTHSTVISEQPRALWSQHPLWMLVTFIIFNGRCVGSFPGDRLPVVAPAQGKKKPGKHESDRVKSIQLFINKQNKSTMKKN